MDNAELSIRLAERLRVLREENGLSYEKLGEELYKRYKDCNSSIPDDKRRKRKRDGDGKQLISKDSLMNYEKGKDHSKAFTNLGMSIEFLNYLADFYGVSTDYLLCRTDRRSPDEGVKAVCASTQLTDIAAEALVKIDSAPVIGLLDALLEAPAELLERIAGKYYAYTYAKNVITPAVEVNRDKLDERDVYADIFIHNGEAMPHVKVQDAEDYARFELWRAFAEFIDMDK